MKTATDLMSALLDELSSYELSTTDDAELWDIIAVFCKHKRLIRILLSLCED